MIKAISQQIIRLQFSSAVEHTALLKYLEPVSLELKQTQQIPALRLKSQKHLMKNWWSEKPFENEGDFFVPIFNFETSEYSQRAVKLPQQIFNRPLRRDLMHRLYDFRINLDKFRTKKTRNRAETSGSGKKIRGQKKTGMARHGDKRAPQLWKGGKAHGAKPKVYSYHLNAKIKLNALTSLLTAKLVEGRIRIVDSEATAEPKTKLVSKILKNFHPDERALYCIITGQNSDYNFNLASKNIKNLIHHTTYDLDVMSLFKADKIFITEKGLEELIENINKTVYVAYRQAHMPKVSREKESAQEEPTFDPEQPYEFKFKILAEYMDLYQKIKSQNPLQLEHEKSKVRKIDVLGL